MKKHAALFFCTGLLIACHKDQDQPVNNWTWFGTQNPSVYNYVLINASQVSTPVDSNEFHIGISAAFIDSSSKRITGINTLSINNTAIAPGLDSTYNYDYGSAKDLQEGVALFGSNVKITIRGNIASDTVSRYIYVPKKLVTLVQDYPHTISRPDGLALHWAPDQDNAWGNVMIQVFYYADLSQRTDSTLPDKISTLSITTPDNGSYFLSPNDFAAFPVKAFIGISIARGTQLEATLPVSQKRIFYFSSASVSTAPLQISK